MRNLRLRYKVNIAILATFALVAVLFSAIQLPFQQQGLNTLMGKIRILLETLVERDRDLLANEIFEGRVRAIKIRLEQMLKVEGILSISVFDATGNLLISDGIHPETAGLSKADQEAAARGKHIRQDLYNERKCLRYLQEIKVIDEHLGFIGIFYSLADIVKEKHRSIVLFWGLLGSILLVMLLLLNILLSYTIIRPITSLRDAMKKFHEEGLGGQVEIKNRDEIGELSGTFNRMSADLVGYYKALQNKNEELERANDSLLNEIKERNLAEDEKRKLQSRLIQAQKMEAIGTLAGGIAHDFNNILSAIIGYTEIVLQDLPNDSLLKKNLYQVLKAGDRARGLVSQILTFSRQTEHELKPIQLTPIIKEALKLLRASLPSTIEIRQKIEIESMVMADPTQIHQVLMNLCANASHAMQEKGGILEVTLSETTIDSRGAALHPELEPGRYVKLCVSDTGSGMSPEIVNRIFDPFFTTKKKGEGTGLGLSVVHGIITEYKGSITVYSEPGVGSTFKIYLPALESGEISEEMRTAPLPRGKERILFVDDEEFQTDLGKQILERLGYHVTVKTSSMEALELFRRRPGDFDLVITDMTMPRMTGEELGKALLSLRPDIPVIICTGYSERITEEKARGIGLRGFVMKPLVMKEIAELVRRVLDEQESPKIQK